MKRSSASSGRGGVKQQFKATVDDGEAVETLGGQSLKSSSNYEGEEEDEVSPYFAPQKENINQEMKLEVGRAWNLVEASQVGSSNGRYRLPRSFYDQECLTLSEALLGTVLVRRLKSGEVLRGTIVETEAYTGVEDPASHGFGGKRTARNEAKFMAPGTAYVNCIHGRYFCFNISSRGDGAASLIRGVEPLEDYGTMHQLRKSKKKGLTQEKRLKTFELANGPSKLCIAFDVSRDKCDKLDMTTSEELWLETSKDLKYLNRNFEVATDKRIGIDSAPLETRNKLYRFYVKDSLAESRAKVGEIKKRLGATDL